jgi:hypothetical protein
LFLLLPARSRTLTSRSKEQAATQAYSSGNWERPAVLFVVVVVVVVVVVIVAAAGEVIGQVVAVVVTYNRTRNILHR